MPESPSNPQQTAPQTELTEDEKALRDKAVDQAARVYIEQQRALAERDAFIRVTPLLAFVPHGDQFGFVKSNARTKVLFGGNRSGKTEAGAFESTSCLIGEHRYRRTPKPPIMGWCVSPELPLSDEPHVQRDKLRHYIPKDALKGRRWAVAYQRGTRTLKFANGSVLVFRSFKEEPDTFESQALDLLWFDEEGPRPLWVSARRGLIDRGGTTLLTMTPLKGMTYIYREIYLKWVRQGGTIVAQGERPEIWVGTIDMDENPHVSQVEKDAFLSGLTEDERRARKEGKFVRRSGLIYPEFEPAVHIMDSRFTPPPHWNWYEILDPGIADPTFVLWGAQGIDNILYVVHAHGARGKTADWHSDRIKQIERDLLGGPDVYRIMDPKGFTREGPRLETWSAEYRRNGLVHMRANPEIAPGINAVKQRLKVFDDEKGNKHSRLYFNPDLDDLVESDVTGLFGEMLEYSWAHLSEKREAEGFSAGDRPQDKFNHGPDCLRYLCTHRALPPDDHPPPGTEAYSAWVRDQEERKVERDHWREQTNPEVREMLKEAFTSYSHISIDGRDDDTGY